MRVEVYWNLHKKLWSIRSKGRVIRHVESVYITKADFVAQPAGKAKVRKTRRKNVHALARGNLSEEFPISTLDRVKYNPYKHTSFVSDFNEQPVYKAEYVYLDSQGRCFGG